MAKPSKRFKRATTKDYADGERVGLDRKAVNALVHAREFFKNADAPIADMQKETARLLRVMEKYE